MTNTERLIALLNAAERANGPGAQVTFMVGKYTGNGPSVVAALRRRGFKVSKTGSIGVASYMLQRA